MVDKWKRHFNTRELFGLQRPNLTSNHICMVDKWKRHFNTRELFGL